jgi:hypothetical protein
MLVERLLLIASDQVSDALLKLNVPAAGAVTDISNLLPRRWETLSLSWS